MEKLRICKVRHVKSPERGTSKSAGIDFFIPFDFERKLLFPKDDILIPSGIVAKIPEGFMLMGADKSSVATSHNALRANGIAPKGPDSTLIVGAKIIDEDYPGEIHIHIINAGSEKALLEPGMKIAQFILVPVSYAEIEETAYIDELGITGERTGGFGSTNK